jgi:hypothetical protein
MRFESMKKEDKVQLKVYLPKNLVEELKRLAFSKYGNFHGALSFEVEQALGVWLATHTQNHTKQLVMNAINPQPKVYKVWNQVKAYLKEKFGYNAIVTQQLIPKKHIIEAIAAIRGDDERTVRKWLENFQKFKLLKWVGGEVYEVL